MAESLKFPDGAGESGAVRSGTIVTLASTPLKNGRSFSAAAADGNTDFADGDPVAVNITDASENFEIWWAVWDETAGTLTRSALKAQKGALGTTGLTVYAVPSGAWMADIEKAHSNHIHGYELAWVSSTTIKARRGEIVINGTEYRDTGDITTLTGDTTLVVDSLYYVYLYDDSGTRKLELDRRVSGTDDPQYDHDRKYWKGPSGFSNEENYRCIGYFLAWDNSGAAIAKFTASGNGGSRCILHTRDCNSPSTAVNDGTNANWTTSVDCAGIIPKNAEHVYVYTHIKNAGSDGTRYASLCWNFPPVGTDWWRGSSVLGLESSSESTSLLPTAKTPIDAGVNRLLYYHVNTDAELTVRIFGAGVRV